MAPDPDPILGLQSSCDALYVVLSVGADDIMLPWPVWEQLVHQASYLYAMWAMAHPSEYLAFEQRAAGLGGPELVRARRAALLG